MKNLILLALVVSIPCAHGADYVGVNNIDPFTQKPLGDRIGRDINNKEFASSCFVAHLDAGGTVCHAETALAYLNSPSSRNQVLHLFHWELGSRVRYIRAVRAGDTVPETWSPYWNKKLYHEYCAFYGKDVVNS